MLKTLSNFVAKLSFKTSNCVFFLALFLRKSIYFFANPKNKRKWCEKQTSVQNVHLRIQNQTCLFFTYRLTTPLTTLFFESDLVLRASREAPLPTRHCSRTTAANASKRGRRYGSIRIII